MFDIGFLELAVVFIVALIVIGPERLPRVARTAGHLLARLQRYTADVKADIEREMQLEELRKLQSSIEQSAREFETSINSEIRAVDDSVSKAVASAVSEAPESPLPAERQAERAGAEAPTIDKPQTTRGLDAPSSRKAG